MNKQLKLKRDEGAVAWQDKGCIEGQKLIWNARTQWAAKDFSSGYDQCLRDVIELIGEFSIASARKADPVNESGNGNEYGFDGGARWQHSEILKKLKGDEG